MKLCIRYITKTGKGNKAFHDKENYEATEKIATAQARAILKLVK